MKLFTTFLLISLIAGVCHAQSQPATPYRKCSVGISAGHYSDDPGIMVNLTTPNLYNNRLALRFAGGVRWSEFYFVETNKPARYSSIQVGVVYFITQQENVRVYSETGLSIIFPNVVFSDKKSVPGVYESLGLDFFLFSKGDFGIAYFFELGMSFNPARAEKLELQPRYSNGLTPVTGFRFHF